MVAKQKNRSNPTSKEGTQDQVSGWKKFCNVIKKIGHWVYRLRSWIITIPVLVVAVKLALTNHNSLPDMVGLGLQNSGGFSYLIPKGTAIVVPLLVTVGCIVMTFLSKRKLYPWLISIFTLALPLLLWITNVYII